MAEYGLWDDEIDEGLVMLLLRGYVQRKRFEARLLVGELGSSMGGNGRSTGGGYNWVEPDQFLSITGHGAIT